MRVGILLVGLLLAPSTGSAETDPDVQALLLRMDDLYRGDESSHGQVRMRVKTARYQREMSMETWAEGNDKTLVQILAPPRDRGMATLKVGTNIWNYLPKVDRTIKVPASMMSGSWMGSHFSNDDLVQASRYSDDYECTALERPSGEQDHWVLECVPHEDAVVVYGKTVLRIRADNEIADEVTDYDERGRLVRTMTMSEIDTVGTRSFPRRMRMVPADEPDEYTEMLYDEIEFEIDLPQDTFTLRSLRR